MKRIIALLLAALMTVACLGVLCACNDNGGSGEQPGGDPAPSAKNTFTLTLVDDTDAPVAGASVKFINAQTGKLLKLLTTDANGKAVYETEDDVTVKAQVLKAEGYIFDATETYEFGEDGTLELVIDAATTAKETYTVYVVDENGNAVEGAYVHICRKGDSEICLVGKYTDADGKVTYDVDAGYEWKAKFVDDTVYTEFGGSKEVTLTYIAE